MEKPASPSFLLHWGMLLSPTVTELPAVQKKKSLWAARPRTIKKGRAADKSFHTVTCNSAIDWSWRSKSAGVLFSGPQPGSCREVELQDQLGESCYEFSPFDSAQLRYPNHHHARNQFLRFVQWPDSITKNTIHLIELGQGDLIWILFSFLWSKKISQFSWDGCLIHFMTIESIILFIIQDLAILHFEGTRTETQCSI